MIRNDSSGLPTDMSERTSPGTSSYRWLSRTSCPLELIRNFIEREFPDLYHTFTIYVKIDSMPGETRHLHVHLMLSERYRNDAKREKNQMAKRIFSHPICDLKDLDEKCKGDVN